MGQESNEPEMPYPIPRGSSREAREGSASDAPIGSPAHLTPEGPRSNRAARRARKDSEGPKRTSKGLEGGINTAADVPQFNPFTYSVNQQRQRRNDRAQRAANQATVRSLKNRGAGRKV